MFLVVHRDAEQQVCFSDCLDVDRDACVEEQQMSGAHFVHLIWRPYPKGAAQAMQGQRTWRVRYRQLTTGIEREENESECSAVEQRYLTVTSYRLTGLGAQRRQRLGQYDEAFGAAESVGRGFPQSRLRARHRLPRANREAGEQEQQ